MIVGIEELERTASECLVSFSHGDQPFHPPQHRVRIILLRFDVERFVVGIRIDHDGKKQAMRACFRESGVPVCAPLHGSAHAVAIAEIDVVAHPDLIAVIQHRRSRQ